MMVLTMTDGIFLAIFPTAFTVGSLRPFIMPLM